MLNGRMYARIEYFIERVAFDERTTRNALDLKVLKQGRLPQ